MCNARTNKREASTVFWWRVQHPNNNFRDGVEASHFAWGNLYCHLRNGVLSMTSYFFFYLSLFSLEIHTNHSKFQNCPLIYWYFNFYHHFLYL
jgi:hypothetical protein